MKHTLAVSMLILVGALLSCDDPKRLVSEDIVRKVERFRQSAGHLPNSLSDIEVEQNESCPRYRKTGGDSYMMW